MKILHLLPELRVGGAERFLARLAPRLTSDYGVEQQVVSLGKWEGEIVQMLRKDGIDVRTSQIAPWLIPAQALWARKAIREFQPNIIQTWLYRYDLLGSFASAGTEAKLVWNLRCSDMQLPLHNRAERQLCAAISKTSPDAIIACGERARAYHTGLGYAADKMRVVGNGYDFDHLPGRSYRNAQDATQNELRIGAAGRYDPVKGYDILLDAVKLLSESRKPVRLVIAGRGCDDDNDELRAMIEAAGLKGRVELLGELSDMSAFYNSLDIFCLSSLSEGFPNVLCEAMAHGVPVVTTDAGDAREIVAGFAPVVAPGDSKQLFHALRDLVELDPAQRYERGIKGAEYVRATYSISAIAAQYFELYSKLAGTPAR
ncbi:hypothetical protein DMP17_02900 [Pseudonocardia sp. TMWB2A]|uniref:glycosyltransferase n=1 Tax=Pseudonocardia sp. TMWB2A TaxID=687430 RepID=UPI00307E1A20